MKVKLNGDIYENCSECFHSSDFYPRAGEFSGHSRCFHPDVDRLGDEERKVGEIPPDWCPLQELEIVERKKVFTDKPKWNARYSCYVYTCPNGRCNDYIFDGQAFCSNCGTKLDWGER